MNKEDFTQTELRMLEVLKDGKPHKPDELIACLINDQGDRTVIRQHISNIRKMLLKEGQDIVCKSNGKNRTVDYVWVRLLSDAPLSYLANG